ncbi:hypothetical protein L6452_43441 [Arctium lappa]|uniref:Uncharacterized protein n=1 Tax=Arctium lappa TaxID=4217 RepID=A0ACB8XD30_ARCLA|nr:hypothetical protein L6452_43441 [Arctium lappa]
MAMTLRSWLNANLTTTASELYGKDHILSTQLLYDKSHASSLLSWRPTTPLWNWGRPRRDYMCLKLSDLNPTALMVESDEILVVNLAFKLYKLPDESVARRERGDTRAWRWRIQETMCYGT